MHSFRRRRGPTTDVDPTHDSSRASELMQAVARGDQAAFGSLYDVVAPLVHGIVLRVIRNPAQAEEVTQEVLLEVWRLAPRFDREKGSVMGWVSSIAHRRAVDRVRSEEAARRREDRDHETVPVPQETVEEIVDDRIDRARVRKALGTLTPQQRSAIELAYDRGHTYREVAVLLDIPEGTAKTRIRDGLIRLRDHLGVTA